MVPAQSGGNLELIMPLTLLCGDKLIEYDKVETREIIKVSFLFHTKPISSVARKYAAQLIRRFFTIKPIVRHL